jgi:hypothetical protein
MRYDYVVILKRDQEQYINGISLWLCILSATAFLFQQIHSGEFTVYLSIAFLLVLTGIAYNFIASRKKKQVYYKSWLLLTGIFWIGMPYLQWLSVLFFLLAFFEYQAKYPLEVGFSDEAVVVNTIFKKKYPWSDFNNIVLRDDLLTLDFKNNKLFQREVLDDDEPDADEDEFNEYCKLQLAKGNMSNLTGSF